jgi:hypothetical protein
VQFWYSETLCVAPGWLWVPTVLWWWISVIQQCFCAVLKAFMVALSPYIKKQTTLTYRGDKSTSKYQSHKNFPE